MKRIITTITVMVVVSLSGAKAQFTHLNSPVGVGIWSSVDDMHLHESVSSDPVTPPVPDNGNRDFFMTMSRHCG